MTEGVIVSWEKQPGDRVARGDVVAQVETDKAIMDVEVFRDGYLSGPLAPVDSTVPVGEPIGYLVASPEEAVTDAAAPAAGGPASAPAAGAAPPAEPKEPPPAEPTEPPPAEPKEPPSTGAGDPADGAGASGEPEGVVHRILMPQLSDTMTEGLVVSWEKQPGDRIERGTVVAQVETDKAIMDVEVFKEGYLSGPLAPVDSTVPVGAPMGYLVERPEQVVTGERAAALTAPAAGETAPARPAPAASGPAATPPARPQVTAAAAPVTGRPAPRVPGRLVTPYARKLAGMKGIDLATVPGTGPGGVVKGADVAAARPAAAGAGLPEVEVPGEGRPMTALEKAISHTMSGAVTMPTFHVTRHIRLGGLIAAAKAQGVSVTVAIARACALAMADHPRMNWCYQPVDKLVERSSVDIGMAVAADGGGLVVPVLRGCERRPLEDLDREWKDLVARARKRRLKPEEYSGASFQISNMGMFGVSQFDAVATPGIAAILAIAADSPAGSPFTITADHRVVNGADVALYLDRVKAPIEQPASWMGAGGKAIPAGDWDYEVVVVGGGPGGEDCARDLAGQGVKVALINDAPLPGGECLWRGCIPSKAWRAAADRIRDRQTDGHLGIKPGRPRLDWAALEASRRQVLEARGDMALKTDRGVRIEYIQGFARFLDPHHLEVDSSGNSEDPHARPQRGDGGKTKRISFGCAVIATGAPPFVPPIPGARERLGPGGGVLTSDSIWRLETLPRRLAVVGGGAIGLEMAQIFQDFGARVTVLEARERILAEVEPEIAAQLTEVLAADPRLELHTGVRIEEIDGEAGAVRVKYQDAEGKAHHLKVDFVVMATGKRPVLDGLGLEALGIEVEQGVIRADAHCRTSLPHVYAIGDVIGGLMLAHTAGQQGRVAAANILGEQRVYDQDKDCGVIFTRPEAAFAGLSLEQARARGLDAVEAKVPISIDAKAMINDERHGMIKLVVDKASHRILGVHLLADHADTLIGEAVMMVSCGLTLEQVGEAIHPHPTQTELFGELARRLAARLRRSARMKK